MINVQIKENPFGGNEYYIYDYVGNYCTSLFSLDEVNIYVENVESVNVFSETGFYNPLTNTCHEHTCVFLAIEKDLIAYAYSFQLGTIINVPLAAICDVQVVNDIHPLEGPKRLLFETMREQVEKVLSLHSGSHQDRADIGAWARKLKNQVLITNEVYRTVTPFWLIEAIEQFYAFRDGAAFLQPVSKVCPDIQVEFEEDQSLRIKYAARFSVNLDSEFDLQKSLKEFAEITDDITSICDVSIKQSKTDELLHYVSLPENLDLLGELAKVESTLRTISRIVTHRKDSYCCAEALPLQLHYDQWKNQLYIKLVLDFNFGKNAHIGDFEDLLKQAFNDFFYIFRDTLNEVTEDTLPF